MDQGKKLSVLSAAIRTDSNLYYFVKDHNLKLCCLSKNLQRVIKIIFPKDCVSSTSVIIDGKIEQLEFCIDANSTLYTYDSSNDSYYYENLNRLICEANLSIRKK